MTEIAIQMGKILRNHRVILGWSQTRLGKEANVTFQQIQKYEKGKNQISPEKLKKFCEIFGIQPADFYGEISDENMVVSELTRVDIRMINNYIKLSGNSKRAVANLIKNLLGEE